MILDQGNKIFIITRRAFEDDIQRHFIGEIVESNDVIASVEGYAYVFDPIQNGYIKRDDKRTKLVSLTDAMNIINILPDNADIESAIYMQMVDKRLVFTDKKSFKIDVNEFSHLN